jgi:hypothetical protein
METRKLKCNAVSIYPVVSSFNGAQFNDSCGVDAIDGTATSTVFNFLSPQNHRTGSCV